MYKLGVIGLGNMGGAIIRGAIKANLLKPEEILAFEHNKEKVADLVGMKVAFARSEEELVKNADYILIAIKPQSFAGLSEKIRGKIKGESLVISIAAGLSIAYIKEMFEHEKVVRVMPNTPALINKGMSSISFDDKYKDDVDFVMDLFKAVGEVAIIPEDKIDAFSGVAGCMPAYVYIFIEAAADAAVKNGLKRKDAYKFAAQTILGSAEMVLQTGKHPGELKDQVTSPGGTTICGLVALEEVGFRNAVIKAVDASTNAKIKL